MRARGPAAWRSCSTARTRTRRPGARPCCAGCPSSTVRVWPELGDPAAIEAALVWRAPPGLLALAAQPAADPVAGCRRRRHAGRPDPARPAAVPAGRPLAHPDDERVRAHRWCSNIIAELDVFAARAAPGALALRAAAAARGDRASASWAWASSAPMPPASCAATASPSAAGAARRRRARRCRHASPARRSWPRSWPAPTILVCLLPLTEATRGILDAGLLARAARGCAADQSSAAARIWSSRT